MKYIGIDPGRSGAIAITEDGTEDAAWIGLTSEPPDILAFISDQQITPSNSVAVLEKVWAVRGQGISSSFKFATNFGWCQGVLDALGLNWVLATPQEWQKELDMIIRGVRTTKEKKSCNIARAVEWFTGINERNVDALLLTIYAQRIYKKGAFGELRSDQEEVEGLQTVSTLRRPKQSRDDAGNKNPRRRRIRRRSSGSQ